MSPPLNEVSFNAAGRENSAAGRPAGTGLSPVGEIGIQVNQSLRQVYREIGSLLGIRWQWAQAEHRVVLADGIDLSDIQGSPLVLVCGPVSGANPAVRKVTLPFNLGESARRCLMAGRDYRDDEAGVPSLDIMLAEIRRVLHERVTGWVELPPVPWGHAYTMTLTHDLDILSLREMPVGRTLLGYFYRSSVVNWRRWRQGKVGTGEFWRAVWEMGRTLAARLGWGRDVWQRALPALLDVERRLGVRSSLYFMPFPGKPGVSPSKPRSDANSASRTTSVRASTFGADSHAAGTGPSADETTITKSCESQQNAGTRTSCLEPRTSIAAQAPANRASFYDVAKQRELLQTLEAGGWEAGVHGIDAWHSALDAATEHQRVAGLSGRDDLGVRMHWLYFQPPESFQALEDGGFLYDSTFGYNEIAGFRAGTLQPYHPLNCERLWELPLHIQDGALLAEEHGDLSRAGAYRRAEPILDWARRLGGVVSLLWHNQSFTAPRFWGEVYRRLIEQGQKDKAWIAPPRAVLAWFEARRNCTVKLSGEGGEWVIECPVPPASGGVDRTVGDDLPAVRVRLHVPPEQIKEMSVPFEAGDGFVDFPAQAVVRIKLNRGSRLEARSSSEC